MPAQKLKIGFVFDDSLNRTDGVQQYIGALGRWFMSQGHEVRFLVGETTDAGDLQPYIYSLAKNKRVRFNKNTLSIPLPASTKRIQTVLDKERFDVLHVQVPYSPFMAGKVIKRAAPETAVIGTFHIIGDSWLENAGSRLLSWLQRGTIRRFDQIGVTSKATREYVKKYYGLKGSDIFSNTVDTARFQRGQPLKELDQTKKTVLFLGRLVERKGCQHLIEAVAHVPKKLRLDLQVIIAGDGPLRERLEQRVAELGLSEVIRFDGFIDEAVKADYYASADVAVFPATGGESFGIVLIEAMAAGSGVVLGGDNPGYSSVLGEQPDLLIDPTDAENFAKRLEHFLTDTKQAKAIHAWQRTEVQRYDVAAVGGHLLEVYRARLAARKT